MASGLEGGVKHASGDGQMRRRRQLNRASVVLAVLLFASLGVTLFISAPASASPTITVTPSSGLANGQTVSVSGAGFDAGSTGAVLECNNDPDQPTITVLGNSIPVSCTNPLSNLHSTDGSGNLPAASFSISTGVTGPPGTGTDSGGGSAATDAARYPCPPTPAQVSAGDSCVISFGDQSGAQAHTAISFSGGTTTTTITTTSSPGSTTTTTSSPATTTTTTPLPGFLTVVAGQFTMIQGPGFRPGESVTATIHSTTIQLATFTANANGVASGTIMVPAGTVVGYHEIYLTGLTSGHVDVIPAWIITGGPATLASSTSSPATSAGSASGGTTTGVTPSATGGSLAYTGAGHGVWLTLFVGLLLLDLGYVLITTFLRPRELLARRANRRLDSTRTV